MTGTNITTTPLVYKGEIIRDRGEMLSLTDMWKAAGSPENKRPAEWARYDGAAFIEFVAETHNVGVAHIMKSTRGKGGATFAHWQIGLAYAKYLTHEFHMWCNEVVRAHMEGKALAKATSLTEYDISIIGNVVKNCAGVVMKEHLGEVLPALLNRAVLAKMAEDHLAVTDGVTAGEVCDLSRVATKYPRGISARVSTHMSRFCKVRNISVPVTRLGRVRAQVFPTHAAREWLDLEGRGLIKRWVAEKTNQTSLRLVGGRAA